MNINTISKTYNVREIEASDIDEVYKLCKKNSLYYEFLNEHVTLESINKDLKALPPRKNYDDKYYLGFYNQGQLVAVLDLIMKFPDNNTAFIGFFMMNYEFQGLGIGTHIINELSMFLKQKGIKYIRLGYVNGNEQSKNFWVKNNFIATGTESKTEKYTIIIMQREL